jgi:pyruvate dehydrogenase E2 component (dihydrolipoamide acetyltransferase)
MKERYKKLDGAELWQRDILQVCEAPGFLEIIEVEMTASKAIVERIRNNGIKGTYTHIFVRAVAIALTRHSDLHQVVTNTQKFYPESVDIGLSIAGSTFLAPVMLLKDAGHKSLKELTVEIINRTPQVREEEKQRLADLRKLGRLVPFGWLRRWILRFLMGQFEYRRNSVGTFQISCVASVDLLAPLMFYTSAVLGVGRVRDRVIAKNGCPQVCPTVFLACSVNHKVWDGMRAARFLKELASILESGELEKEVD